MSERSHRQWLRAELDRLVEAAVLTPEAALRVRQHYAAAETSRAAVPLFALLGAVFIGLGVILLLAVNWEELSRDARAALCFGLLLAGQAIAALALWRRRTSVAWSEAAPTGLALAVAAAIALIGQTYQIQGNLRGFLGTCLWLVLPLPYLFDSRATAVLVLLATSAWLAASLAPPQDPTALVWVFWLLIAPYLWLRLRENAAPIRDGFLAWVAIPSFLFCLLLGIPLDTATGYALLWSALVAGIAGGGMLAAQRRPVPAIAGAATSFGSFAVAGTVFALGYVDSWGFVGEAIGRETTPWYAAGALLVGSAAAALAACGGWDALRRRDAGGALVAGLPLLVAAGVAILEAQGPKLAASALANLYALALGVMLTLAGLRAADLRVANAGLFFLAALVFARFSDWQIDFTARGVVFISVGVGFLLLNLRLRSTRKAGAS